MGRFPLRKSELRHCRKWEHTHTHGNLSEMHILGPHPNLLNQKPWAGKGTLQSLKILTDAKLCRGMDLTPLPEAVPPP